MWPTIVRNSPRKRKGNANYLSFFRMKRKMGQTMNGKMQGKKLIFSIQKATGLRPVEERQPRQSSQGTFSESVDEIFGDHKFSPLFQKGLFHKARARLNARKKKSGSFSTESGGEQFTSKNL